MNGVIAAVNLAVSISYSAFFKVSVYDAVRNLFTALLLVEAGALFLLGGFVAYGGTIFVSKVRQHILKTGGDWKPEDAMRGEENALSYVLLASLLFAESLLLSLIL
jgi:hypothetical protein